MAASSVQAGGRKPLPVPPAVAVSTPTVVQEVPVVQAPPKSTVRQPRGLSSKMSALPGTDENLRVYKVWIWQESGDCLWKIAKENYGNPHLWPKIYEANRSTIKDPGVIYPKQRILIPPLEESEGDAPTKTDLDRLPW